MKAHDLSVSVVVAAVLLVMGYEGVGRPHGAGGEGALHGPQRSHLRPLVVMEVRAALSKSFTLLLESLEWSQYIGRQLKFELPAGELIGRRWLAPSGTR